MDIQGKWSVRYSTKQDSVFVNEEGDPEETGEVVLSNGSVNGFDPWNANYVGSYRVDGSAITATVKVSSNEVEHPFIFEGVPNPFDLELKGEYNSPDIFSMTGFVVQSPEFEIVLNCKRMG